MSIFEPAPDTDVASEGMKNSDTIDLILDPEKAETNAKCRQLLLYY